MTCSVEPSLRPLASLLCSLLPFTCQANAEHQHQACCSQLAGCICPAWKQYLRMMLNCHDLLAASASRRPPVPITLLPHCLPVSHSSHVPVPATSCSHAEGVCCLFLHSALPTHSPLVHSNIARSHSCSASADQRMNPASSDPTRHTAQLLTSLKKGPNNHPPLLQSPSHPHLSPASHLSLLLQPLCPLQPLP